MIDLLKAKMGTWYLTYQASAKKIYKKLGLEKKEEQSFAEIEEALQAHIKSGNIKAVKEDMASLTLSIRKLFQLVNEIQRADIMLMNKIVGGTHDELVPAKDLERLAKRIKLLPDALTSKTLAKIKVKSEDDFHRFVVKTFDESFGKLEKIHNEEMKDLMQDIKFLKQEHYALGANIDMKRLSQMQAAFSSFPEYQAELAARFIRWNVKDPDRAIKKVEAAEEKLKSLCRKPLGEAELKVFIKSLHDLVKGIDSQISELHKLSKSATFLFQYQVHKFFKYFRENLAKVNGDIEQLRKEGFPIEDLKATVQSLQSMKSEGSGDVLASERIARDVAHTQRAP